MDGSRDDAPLEGVRAEAQPHENRLRNARQDRFDFLGYSFGPHCFRQTGRWFIGASPGSSSGTCEERAASEGEGGGDPGPGNMGPWEGVRDTLEPPGAGVGWVLQPGSHYVTDRAIEAICMTTCATSSFGVTRCRRAAHGSPV